MDRRQILKAGAALSLLPLTGCGAGPKPPEVAVAATRTPSAPGTTPPLSLTPEATVPPTTAEETATQPEAPSHDEAPRAALSRVVARVGKNHGHVLTMSLADVTAGAEKTYDLTGKAKHAHSVTLTPEHMRRLLAGELVRTESTTGLHAHRIVLRGAPAVDPPEWVSVVKFASSGKDEHEIVITAADMSAKLEKTYDVQGLAGHPHQVTVSAADFDKLSLGGPVTRHTTRDEDDGHLHTVTIEYSKARG